MKQRMNVKLFVVTLLVILVAKVCYAQKEVLISDILSDPQKFVNATVVINATVMNVTAEPAGTTKGNYEITDDSEEKIFVKTKQLPQVGKDIQVTAVVTIDKDTSQIYLKELERSSGVSANLYIIIGGSALLVIIIAIVVVLMRPSKKAPVPSIAPTVSKSSSGSISAPSIKPSTSPQTIKPNANIADKTMAVTSSSGAQGADKTLMALPVNAELAVTAGRDSGKRFPIMKPLVLIGRSGSRPNDIDLSEPSVSREQAKIVLDQGANSFTLINESTTNPTKVNGQQINSVVLSNNDELTLGNCKMVFRIL